MPLIPQRSKEIPENFPVVIFDLDETLVQNRGPELLIRPYAQELLKYLCGKCELILWTASIKNVVSNVIKVIDPDGNIFDHIICRNPDWFTFPEYTKNIELLGRNPERIVIVENCIKSVKNNPQNAIMVNDYLTNDNEDNTLLNVQIIIDQIIENVSRPVSEIISSSPVLLPRSIYLESDCIKVFYVPKICNRKRNIESYQTSPIKIRNLSK